MRIRELIASSPDVDFELYIRDAYKCYEIDEWLYGRYGIKHIVRLKIGKVVMFVDKDTDIEGLIEKFRMFGKR